MKKIKDSDSKFRENPVIISLVIILIAGCAVWFFSDYHNFFDYLFLNDDERLLKDKDDKGKPINIVGLSNIRRNYFLLFFAVIAGALAIWAQFNRTKQIEISRTTNRNDRFAKALEMLGLGDTISHKGGLYMLHDVAGENLIDKYIHCAEILADWVRREKEPPPEHKQIAMDIFKYKRSRKLKNNIKKYKKEYKLPLWPKLQTIQLQELDLENANLFEADLQSANLERVNLQGANLEKANLQSAILTRAELQNSNLMDAKLGSADFMAANLEGAKFEWEKLKNANLQSVKFGGVNLARKNLERLELQNVNLMRSNLQESNLRRADLRAAVLIYANLRNANLFGTILVLADLHFANLKGARLQATNLEGANLIGANLQGALISDVTMEKVKGLRKEQILKATWKDESGYSRPPKLPNNLTQDPDVQEWLKKPPFEYKEQQTILLVQNLIKSLPFIMILVRLVTRQKNGDKNDRI